MLSQVRSVQGNCDDKNDLCLCWLVVPISHIQLLHLDLVLLPCPSDSSVTIVYRLSISLC